jgi:Fe-S cluster assembly ATP-binding protein
VTDGDIRLDGVSVMEMEADERARAGLFLAFQYPVELPGVGGMSFLRGAVNARRIEAGLDEIDHIAFVKTVREAANKLGIKDDMLKRAVNVGFSGGEKKRYEILQMALLEPKMAILDETDSGLDVDALRIVSEGVNALKTDDIGVLVITHYQRLLDYIIPDHVHILADGKIVKSGDKTLALEVEKSGYGEFTNAA